MTLERRDIEEVGEAVEALGIMLEEELAKLNERLGELHVFVTQIKEDGQSSKQKMLELKEEMTKAYEVIKGLENIISRTESRWIDLQKNISDEEDLSEEIKNDLLIIKRDLQLVRSDLKELLEQKRNLEK